MTAETTTLRRISSRELDEVISRLVDEEQPRLALLGPGATLPDSREDWPPELRSHPIIFQLTEAIDDLGMRLLALSQLTSLVAIGSHIDDAGAEAIASLTQLTSLNLTDNQIGDTGAKKLASLAQLTSLNLGYNQIGNAGAKGIASLTQLTSLNLTDNQIGNAGAKQFASLTQLTSLDL